MLNRKTPTFAYIYIHIAHNPDRIFLKSQDSLLQRLLRKIRSNGLSSGSRRSAAASDLEAACAGTDPAKAEELGCGESDGEGEFQPEIGVQWTPV